MKFGPAAGIFCAAWLMIWPALAQSPDDQFIKIYNLIQQADTLRGSGQNQAARERYLEARDLLVRLRAEHPAWNPKILDYRLGYVAEHIGPGALPADRAPTSSTTPKPATPTAAAPSARAEDSQVAELNEQIAQLQQARALLEAKLREALSAQPATLDPRELARAEERVKELTSENENLRGAVRERDAKLAQAAEPGALDEARRALQEARSALERQSESTAALAREKEALVKQRDQLEAQLETANEKARQKSAKEEKTAARRPPSESDPALKEARQRVTELTQRLESAEKELRTQKSKTEVLETEKATLEKRVAELAGSAAPGAPPPKETKASRAAEKAQIKQLEREREELRKRVAALSRELDQRRLRTASGPQNPAAEQIMILRARLEAYETRTVPYTEEELALLKATPETTPATNRVAIAKGGDRRIPAGAAPLVAEAERAYQGRRWEEASRKLEQALAVDERNAEILKKLAAAYMEQGRLGDAEATLKRASEQVADDPDNLALLGLLRLRQEKDDEALDLLARAAQLNPDDAFTQNYLGVALSQKGQRGPAETAFRRAIQLTPGYAEAHFNLAIVYARQKPTFRELARWHYEKALAGGQPRNLEVEKLLAQPAQPAEPAEPATTK